MATARTSAALLLLVAAGQASAGDVTWQGFVDARLVAGDDRSWVDGGLGKTRFGDDDRAHVGGALALSWQAAPELLFFVELQAQQDQDPRVDLTTAFVRWRPVSTSAWRTTLKAGVFFPQVSLENDSLGWTSRWTLTPSAINSWIGEELRNTGLEGQLEYRGEAGTWSATFGLFGGNEAAGELIATRGWALGDYTTGYSGFLRQPDVHAPAAQTSAPFGFEPFQRIRGAVGWNAGLRWDSPAAGEFTLLRYDNRADPEAFRDFADRRLFAWHTRFWAAGWRHRFGDVQLVAQAMDGSTSFEPVEGLYLESRFSSAFLLAAWEAGAWRPAVRFETFRVRGDEDGHAVTAALNWRPSGRWRITGEWLRVTSDRPQRLLGGEAARQVQDQVQLSVRWLF